MAELASAAPTSGGVSNDGLTGQRAKIKHCYATHLALFLDSLLFFSQMAQSPCLDSRLYGVSVSETTSCLIFVL
jgi:hypothetical protein